MDSAAGSIVICSSKSPAKQQIAAMPKPTGTHTSGNQPKPIYSAGASIVVSAPKKTAKQQKTAMPKRTVTHTSGKPPKRMDSAAGPTIVSASKSPVKQLNTGAPKHTLLPVSWLSLCLQVYSSSSMRFRTFLLSCPPAVSTVPLLHLWHIG